MATVSNWQVVKWWKIKNTWFSKNSAGFNDYAILDIHLLEEYRPHMVNFEFKIILPKHSSSPSQPLSFLQLR